ncbi:MAG: 16S rRNA (adenine(1518)-N(6)/adenine(1519)-N(6))-dimethyltransferase RsmA [Actinobacteria bacterium]|nr:16S rRNA (adenine(1518)-N(6)/adenine(1519)-N(6))-dimethyltransferase RsmA [Actinomycetota bacterium]
MQSATFTGIDLLTPTDIERLCAAHGLRPSRALGQNFLADANTARRIARLAAVGPQDRVVEIGPGVGSLTLALAETGASVLAVERDRHLLPVLAEVTGSLGNVEVFQGDALDIDWSRLLGPPPPDGAPGPWILVSNLPYNVATPIVATVLESVPQVGRMLVMVQREVAERLAAPPGTRAGGAISVKVAYFSEAEVVGRVPPTVFMPRPKVDSSLVAFRRRSAPAVAVGSPERLFALVRAGFAHRRKMLRRALSGVVPDAAATLANAGIDAEARAEQLSLDDWARLTEAVHS